VPAAGAPSNARKGNAKRGAPIAQAQQDRGEGGEAETAAPAPIPQDGGGAEVVRLDRFRKK
jgi:hypothetical protein